MPIPTDQGTSAQDLLATALAARRVGNLLGAAKAYKRAVELAKGTNDARILALAYDNLGNVLCDLGSFDEALGCYDHALAFEIDPKEKVINPTGAERGVAKIHSPIDSQDV